MAALCLMIAGMISTFVAVATGGAAAAVAAPTPGVEALLITHARMAQTTQFVFAILTCIYGLLVVVPLLVGRSLSSNVRLAAHGAFVLLFAGSLLLLVGTAHQGGLLVHRHGLHARLGEPAEGGVQQ
ncbi:DUF2231 domain-containing protein [bacterium]|nr:DUF2231 domain-containing protein [bacterium]